MKLLRIKFIQAISIWLVITGLLCINASIGKLSYYFPNSNINNLLVEEINKDIEDSSTESGSGLGGDNGFMNEHDWHTSSLFHLADFIRISQRNLSEIVLMNFGHVHLDIFSPPPKV